MGSSTGKSSCKYLWIYIWSWYRKKWEFSRKQFVINVKWAMNHDMGYGAWRKILVVYESTVRFNWNNSFIRIGKMEVKEEGEQEYVYKLSNTLMNGHNTKIVLSNIFGMFLYFWGRVYKQNKKAITILNNSRVRVLYKDLLLWESSHVHCAFFLFLYFLFVCVQTPWPRHFRNIYKSSNKIP